MKYTLERIEDNIAVLEDEQGRFIEVDSVLLPENAKIGSILLFENENYHLFGLVDEERKQRIQDKYKMLFDKTINKSF